MTTAFPGLHDDGVVITYNRDVALANEDMQFLTWEHPMVIHALDRVLSTETGNASVSSFSHRDAKPGTVFIECLFVLVFSASNNRYLPPAMIRILTDEHGHSDYPALEHESINQCLTTVSHHIAKQVIELKKEIIKNMITVSETMALAKLPVITKQAGKRIEEIFIPEIERLKALKQVNPNVRQDEIRFFEQQLQDLTQALNSTQIRLDAIRVLVAT